jgi:hypothetical protein
MAQDLGGNKVRELPYTGACVVCGTPLNGRLRSYSGGELKDSYCLEHTPSGDVAQGYRHDSLATSSLLIDSGVVGGGAIAGYDPRSSSEQLPDSSYPYFGPLLIDGSDLCQSSNFSSSGKLPSSGGTVQEVMRNRLDGCANQGVIALHHRLVLGYGVTIAAIAIGPSGVYVIDVKEDEAGTAGGNRIGSRSNRRPARLLVNGQERTDLVLKMAWQMDVVRSALDGLPEARGARGQAMLAFVGAKWALLRSGVDIDGVLVAWPQKIAKIVSRPGKLTRTTVARIAEQLAAALPQA